MVTSWSRHAFFCGTNQVGGGKSAYVHFGMQTNLLLSLFHIQNGGIWSWFGMLKWVSISYVTSLATSFKILSNSFDGEPEGGIVVARRGVVGGQWCWDIKIKCFALL